MSRRFGRISYCTDLVALATVPTWSYQDANCDLFFFFLFSTLTSANFYNEGN